MVDDRAFESRPRACSTRWLQSKTRRLCLVACSLTLCAARPASAWDVATTHLDLSEATLLATPVHRVWMEASGMRTGVFSQLSLQPSSLDPLALYTLQEAISRSPGRAMAQPIGGEPLCPPGQKSKDPKQPCTTRRAFAQDALAWLRLGVLTASSQPYRMQRHILPPLPGEPTATPAWFQSAQKRHNHAPLAASLAGAHRVRGPGPKDFFRRQLGWSLRDLAAAMAQSAIAKAPKAREQALAQSMLLWGMTLHLVQDQTLPAIARGELDALFESLSPRPHDRGSRLSQWVKRSIDRASIDAMAKEASLPRPLKKLDHWSGVLSRTSPGGKGPSLSRYVARHFISPATYPKPRVVDWSLDPQQAANELFAGVSLHLRDAERDGLMLEGWPKSAGYLSTASGRMLASYQKTRTGKVRLVEDPATMAEEAEQLLSLALATGKTLLARAWQLPPPGVSDPTQDPIWRENWVRPQALMLQELANGERKVVERWHGKLPDDGQILRAQAKASSGEAVPVFVVYESDHALLPKLLHWRLPLASQGPASPVMPTPTQAPPAAADSGAQQREGDEQDASERQDAPGPHDSSPQN